LRKSRLKYFRTIATRSVWLLVGIYRAASYYSIHKIMSVVVENILHKLREWQSSVARNENATSLSTLPDSNFDDYPVLIILRLLCRIESFPMRSAEMKMIIAEVDKAITSIQKIYPHDFVSADIKYLKAILECRSNFSFLPCISRYKDLVPTPPNASPLVVAEMNYDTYSQTVKLNSIGRCFSPSTETVDEIETSIRPKIGPLHINLPNNPVRDVVFKEELPIAGAENISSKTTTPMNNDSGHYSQQSLPAQVPTAIDSFKPNQYYVCNIVRHPSTLWTSYRLYLDHVMELSSSGELLPDSANTISYRNSNALSNNIDSHSSNELEASQSRSNDVDKLPAASTTINAATSNRGLFLLGAKKLKSVTLSSQWCVWDSSVSAAADSKCWKEKNVTGKVFVTKSSSVNTTSLASPARVSIPKLYSGSLAFPSANPSLKQRDSSEDVIAEDGEDSSVVTSNVAASKQQSSSGFSESVAIAVSSRGSDKLIQVTAVVPRPCSAEEALKNIEENPNKNINVNNNDLQGELEAILRSNNQSLIDCSKYLLLRSKLPRKILTQNGKKGVHAVEFGKFSRVKEPSRKNMVIDSVFDSGGTFATEWLSNADKPPILQIGKIDEDCFSLDFYSLSPFQAFAIALAAFDQ